MPHLLPFIAVATVLIVVPGADMALVTRNTLAGGKRAGRATSLGIVIGVLFHGMAAVLGLSAIIATSASTFRFVKVAGAAYLVVLGLRTMMQARSAAPSTHQPTAAAARAATPFREGVLTNVLNPKIAVFFISLMPQFIDEQFAAIPQIIVLSVLYALMGVVWLVTYVQVVDVARDRLRQPWLRRKLDVASGAVLIALGVRLVLGVDE